MYIRMGTETTIRPRENAVIIPINPPWSVPVMTSGGAEMPDGSPVGTADGKADGTADGADEEVGDAITCHPSRCKEAMGVTDGLERPLATRIKSRSQGRFVEDLYSGIYSYRSSRWCLLLDSPLG